MRYIKNPFYLYIIIFIIIILFYQLSWSNLYPTLRYNLILFFLITFIISFFLGKLINYYNPIKYEIIEPVDRSKMIVFLIMLAYALEFIYNRGVPILLVIKKSGYDYKTFGIPTFHTFLVTFTSFYAVYLFHKFISVKKKRTLLYFFLLISNSLLIYNRGMLLIILTSCFFVFVLSINRLGIKRLLFVIFIIFLVLFMFGVTGNFRISKGRTTSSRYFLKASRASQEFKDTKIPKEFMWSYIYISSPIGNLQNNIDNNPGFNNNFKSFFFNELFPDFISKRISGIVNSKRAESPLIVDWLTVGTIYSRSYTSLGWFGMAIIFFEMIGITFIYTILLKRNNKFYITGIALINTFIVYNTFSNMIYFSGISLQLIYPILSMYFKKISIR